MEVSSIEKESGQEDRLGKDDQELGFSHLDHPSRDTSHILHVALEFRSEA